MKKCLITLISLFVGISFIFAAKVDTVLIHSASMHKDIRCVVVLPDTYKTSTVEYPVLYLLHGYSGDYANWVKNAPDFIKCVDRFGIIGICPDGHYNSWYFDSPIDNKVKYETFVSKEVPAYVDSHYRTKKDRKFRALGGLSMGGHGALYLGIRHKDFFGAAVSMSGGVDITPFAKKWDIAAVLGPYETNKERWEQHTVQYLAGTLNNGDLAISFECGTGDFFLGVNRALHLKLQNLKIDHDYAERPGQHNWVYWNNAINYQMLFLHRFFEKNEQAPKS